MMELADAIKKKRVEDVKDLISKGADVNQEVGSLGRTPLMIAAETGSVEIVKLLVEAGADPSAKDSQQYTVLNYAFKSGNAETEQFLAEMNIDFYPDNPFLYINRPRGLAMCLESGGDANKVNPGTGLTALHQAVNGHQFESVKVLLEMGADVNAREQDVLNHMGFLEKKGSDNTALAQAATYSSPEMAELLIQAGADVNARSSGGFTPLMVAAGRGNTEVVKELLRAGADAGVAAKNDKTALQLAKERGYAETVKVLRKYS
jgi:ankyrin repeat protein